MVRIKIIVKSTILCPYCSKKPILRTTCGDFKCQFKHHILHMRKRRKTDRIDTVRRKEL